MKRKRFSNEQIVGVLQEAAGATTAREVCRRHGITETTFYRWRAKYGGMQKAEIRRLKQLEDEQEHREPEAHDHTRVARDGSTGMHSPGVHGASGPRETGGVAHPPGKALVCLDSRRRQLTGTSARPTATRLSAK